MRNLSVLCNNISPNNLWGDAGHPAFSIIDDVRDVLGHTHSWGMRLMHNYGEDNHVADAMDRESH